MKNIQLKFIFLKILLENENKFPNYKLYIYFISI